ncbi:MAG: sugar phosphate isomerase/epimerase [Deltaproteobacteria bacterium]|nr:sugar phosphate isomerase/epimerase [Deltaproteobacteria bacterium]
MWERKGLAIAAMQSLLYGRPDLTVFGSESKRAETLAYLGRMIDLAAGLGAGVLVFGSPKKSPYRRAARRSNGCDRALVFFAPRRPGRVGGGGDRARSQSDGLRRRFLTRAEEAKRFVVDLNHPGVCLHLCSGCMALAGDDAVAAIRDGAPWLRHFHISAPFLEPLRHADLPHEALATALRGVGYRGWASIEMKTADPFSMKDVEEALAIATRYYAGG